MRRLLLAVFFIIVAAFPAFAQEGDPKEQLTKEIWCPVCNGIRLDVCEQAVCEQMRDMIDQELAAGKTPEQIKADFIDLYGPVVLGEPPREGFNLVAWIAPIVLLAGGIAIVVYMTRRWTTRPAPAAAAATPASGQPAPAPQDPYLARVERDLSDS